MARYLIRVARHAGLVAVFVAVALLGIATGLAFVFAGDLPEISALDDYAPNTITRVYGAQGDVVAEFATERRIVVTYDEIGTRLRQAILAAEDAGFDRHVGLSISRIAVTAIRDVLEGRRAGASTLTQQLARMLFLTPEKTWERKIKEAILAIQIEKRYTKPEIFTLYCNKVYLGHGSYGVEVASRLYFNKHARDLSLEEAALIAGIIQTPERQSPFVDMTRARRRRDYVLQRMADEGYIAAAEAEAAKARPIVVADRHLPEETVAPFFVEEVRKTVERQFGAQRLYESGLAVYTSLDTRLQVAANQALDRGLRQLDKRRGFRKPGRNILTEGTPLDRFTDERWSRPMKAGDVVPALVTAVSSARGPAAGVQSRDGAERRLPAGAARLRIGRFSAELGREAIRWTGRTSAADLVRAGDLIEVRLTKLDEAAGLASVTLEQTPLVDGAILVIENRTGQIKAMVGGLSFVRSKFNRATQAMRQLGSAFKPIVYTAAIDRGYTPVSQLLDAPVSYPAGPGQPPYTPGNYDGRFEGLVTLRHALEQSRNVPAVRTMAEVGAEQVIQYARRFGFQGPMEPYLSLALGASEASLLEATAAYSVFPNQGVLMRPYFILRVLDREGNLLEETRPEGREAIRADTAYVMTSLLRGVVERGTAASAASLEWPLAGKTGTTNDYTDAWFIGFDPELTVGVWVGHDDKKPLGPAETGAQAALPIWIDVMKAHLASRTDRTQPPSFEIPGNIVIVPVDRLTGAVVAPGTPGALSEAFIAGTQPGSTFAR